jgi:tight adherence protein C
MNELSWLLAVSLGVFALSFGALWLLTRPRKRTVPPLPDAAHEPDPEPAKPVLGRLTEALAAQLPMTRAGKSELEVALKTAGFYQPSALIDYAAVRALLVIGAVLATGLVAMLVAPDRVRYVMLVGAIAAVLGFSVPRFFLMVRGRHRCREIDRGLPFVIDLLALALAAGQNTLNALRQVAQEVAYSHPALADELQIVHRHAALSSLTHALEQLADRVPVPAVRNLALLLIQSERLGADASNALLEYSAHHRTGMRQNAEAVARRTTFWMMFPSICCLWVAAMALLIGPLYYEFWRQWGNTAQAAHDMQTKLRQIDNGQARPAANPPERPLAP